MLGLAFGQRVLSIAELSADGKTVELLKRGEFELPVLEKGPDKTPEAAAKQLEASGKKLAEFLKQNGFSAKQACIGLPTQWLMLKEKQLPAVGGSNLAGMLLLQSERDFSLEPKDLVLDFYATNTTGADGKPALAVLLAAGLRERVEHCQALALAAGLSVKSITSSAVELAQAANQNALIHAGAFGADLLVRAHDGLYVPAVLSSSPKLENADAWAAGLGLEARRHLALRAGLAGSAAPDTNGSVALWNAAEINGAAISTLSESLGREVRALTELKAGGTAIAGLSPSSHFAVAALLARKGLSDQPPSLDFLNSKLVEKKKGKFANVKNWMWAAALLGFGLFVTLMWTWIADSSEVSMLKKQSDARKAEVDAAKLFLARYASAQGWYDKRPNILDSMKALTRVIPSNGDAWISNLSMKEDFHCIASMKAVDSKVSFEAFDAIEKDETFREVKLVYWTQPDKKKTEVSFAISFVYWKQ